MNSVTNLFNLFSRLDKASRKRLNLDEIVNSVSSLETDIKNNEQIRDWSALLKGTSDSRR